MRPSLEGWPVKAKEALFLHEVRLTGIFIVTPSLEGWPTEAKEAPSPHYVSLVPLDTMSKLGRDKA